VATTCEPRPEASDLHAWQRCTCGCWLAGLRSSGMGASDDRYHPTGLLESTLRRDWIVQGLVGERAGCLIERKCLRVPTCRLLHFLSTNQAWHPPQRIGNRWADLSLRTISLSTRRFVHDRAPPRGYAPFSGRHTCRGCAPSLHQPGESPPLAPARFYRALALAVRVNLHMGRTRVSPARPDVDYLSANNLARPSREHWSKLGPGEAAQACSELLVRS